MIRYAISEEELVARINKQNKTWIQRARERTHAYVDRGNYTDENDFWGQIKQVYIDLQHEKCAYCETKLQGAVLASKVHEVEHYRPKSSVKAWPNKKVDYWKEFNHPWPTGDASKNGYYRLAYHYLNYAIACTRCNSTLKSNYFPVRGPRDFDSASPMEMHDELPLLLYPVGSVDADDPEDIITFNGVLAVAANKDGPKYERAITTIEFFQLNSQDLTSRRADLLKALIIALEPSGAPAQKRQKEQYVKIICSEQCSFSSCMRAYRKLSKENPVRAAEIAEELFSDLAQ